MSSAGGRLASRAARRLRAAALFGAVGVGLSGVYAATGLGVPCPWRALTHTLCPLCGATTMGSHLLHGEIAAAWQANAFVFVLLGGLVLSCTAWTIEVLGGPALRLPGRDINPRWTDQRLWYGALGVAALVFMVVRNLGAGTV